MVGNLVVITYKWSFKIVISPLFKNIGCFKISSPHWMFVITFTLLVECLVMNWFLADHNMVAVWSASHSPTQFPVLNLAQHASVNSCFNCWTPLINRLYPSPLSISIYPLWFRCTLWETIASSLVMLKSALIALSLSASCKPLISLGVMYVLISHYTITSPFLGWSICSSAIFEHYQ